MFTFNVTYMVPYKMSLLLLQTNNLRKFAQFVSYTETRMHQDLNR